MGCSSYRIAMDGPVASSLDALMEVELPVLLNARCLVERPTVLTSNDRPHALPARLHSRIAEQAQIVWMPLSDYWRIGP